MAVDPHGHLAVWGYEGEGAFSTRQFGFLYEADDGHLLTVFPTPELLRSETMRVFEGITGLDSTIAANCSRHSPKSQKCGNTFPSRLENW